MEDTREVIDEALPLEPTSVSETPEESPPNLIDDNDSTKATAASENDKIVEETDTTETATTEKATTETATTEIATQPHGRKRKIADPESTDEQSANDSSDSKEIKLPPKQLLGKGKRARIPNKRYSDILLNPSPRANSNAELTIEDPRKSKSSLENGEIKDHSDTSSAGKENIESETGSVTDLREDSAFSSPSLKASRTNPSSNSSTPIAKKPKITVDLTNPNYRKPFQHGWKRELVYRTTSESAGRRNGDIYYYTPSGKKVRSMREVSENLKNKELTLDDFTFFKEPLGIDDPEKEIIRDAKFKSERPMKKASPKVSSTKVLSPKLASRSIDSPKVKNSPKLGGFKVKLPSKGNNKSKLKKKDGDAEELEMGTYPPNWTPPATKKNAKKTPANLINVDNKPCRPCSIRCQGVTGIIPTLQCRSCLCLYHNECVGLAPHANVQGYVCKNCQLDQDPSTPTVAPPPLTPINTLKPTQPTVLPKLQRIPKPGETPPPNLPKLHPKPSLISSKKIIPRQESKSLVGSVTTWFPSSSTIQVGNAQMPVSNSPVQAPRPQFVEFLGDKKFLIIPKHNILSVASPQAATAPKTFSVTDNVSFESKIPEEGLTNIENFDSASLGPGDIKTEPIETPTVDPIPETVTGEETANQKPELREETTTDDLEIVSPPVRRKRGKQETPAPVSNEKTDDSRFMENYLQNLSYGYNTLLYVFQYLKVQDLLRASCVCTMWRDIASHPVLWRTVRMKNSQIHSFDGLADALEKHGTSHLDLRKMLLPANGDDMWPQFSRAIKKVDSLRKIELCRCPAIVVEQLALSNPKLEVINAITIKCDTMSLAPLMHLKNLQELRLKSTSGFTLTSDLTALSDLKQLKCLSLTSIKLLNNLNIGVIADLKYLESLDLGECTDFPKTFGIDILHRLDNLEKLRLEKGQGNCYTFEILDAVKNMPKLEQLELVNFDIKTGFDKALGACTNIKKLLIIPTYISQSATTNHMVLGGVLRLQKTLTHFVWGVTLELLRVTELFVDQCEEPDKKEKKERRASGNGDSIPVLKPVPLLHEGDKSDIPPAQDPPQVEILPLPNLQKLLLQNLPTTRVKILKIPFHATWRQSITDTVN